MAETRARRRIRQAVESRGYSVQKLTWESWYDGGEMSGICGGWDLYLDRDYLPNTFPGNQLGALAVDELLAQIDYWLKPDGPCDCDRSHSADMASRIINDPQKPTHGPECRWHIRYRLPWWPSTETPERNERGK